MHFSMSPSRNVHFVMSSSNTGIQNHLRDVSVLLTNYNKGEHLNVILELCSKLLSKSAEIVIVDDGSNDGSFQTLFDFSIGKSGIQVVTQVNQGSAVSRNRAVSLASRKFLVFLDFDDLLSINVLEKAIMDLQTFNAPFALLNYEINPGRTSSTMPVKVEKPELLKVAFHRSEFFRSMGYWRYVYSRDFVMENNLKFSPSFSEVGGNFILDDIFWVIHNCSLDYQVLVFPEDEILYTYDLGGANRMAWVKYQRQVMLFPKAMSIFIAYIQTCEHTHDSEWLREMLPKIVFEHLRFLLFGQLLQTLPSYYRFLSTNQPVIQNVTFGELLRDTLRLLVRSFKNSIIRFQVLKSAIDSVRGFNTR